MTPQSDQSRPWGSARLTTVRSTTEITLQTFATVASEAGACNSNSQGVFAPDCLRGCARASVRSRPGTSILSSPLSGRNCWRWGQNGRTSRRACLRIQLDLWPRMWYHVADPPGPSISLAGVPETTCTCHTWETSQRNCFFHPSFCDRLVAAIEHQPATR